MLVREDEAWDYAVGMIKVDGLEPTPEMRELIEREKRGEITLEQVRETLDQRYKMNRSGTFQTVWRSSGKCIPSAKGTRGQSLPFVPCS